MTDEKVVQLAEKHRIAGSDGALAAIREAYDVGRRDGLEEAAKNGAVVGRLTTALLKLHSGLLFGATNEERLQIVREALCPTPAAISSSANSVEGGEA